MITMSVNRIILSRIGFPFFNVSTKLQRGTEFSSMHIRTLLIASLVTLSSLMFVHTTVMGQSGLVVTPDRYQGQSVASKSIDGADSINLYNGHLSSDFS